jgi:hypothetical protein
MGRLASLVCTLLFYSGGIPGLYYVGFVAFSLTYLTSRKLEFSPHTVIDFVKIVNFSMYLKLFMGIFIQNPLLYVSTNLELKDSF